MTLTDPQSGHAEQSTFISYLVGVAGLGSVVHSLAADVAGSPREADDFVYLLLGLASTAAGIERLAVPAPPEEQPTAEAATPPDTGRWLR